MSADIDSHHIESRLGFADHPSGRESSRPLNRALPWQPLLDALEQGDIESARRHHQDLLIANPSWRQTAWTEIGALISSANYQAALKRLKALPSPAYLFASANGLAVHRPAVTIRTGADTLEIVGLKLDLTA
jgi:hypothetical protein